MKRTLIALCFTLTLPIFANANFRNDNEKALSLLENSGQTILCVSDRSRENNLQEMLAEKILSLGIQVNIKQIDQQVSTITGSGGDSVRSLCALIEKN